MMHVNTVCRDCGSTKLVQWLDLGSQPPANRFLSKEDLTQPEPSYPLEAWFCNDCNLAQLVHVVDKSELFRNYVYFSAPMPKVSAYWQSYADDVMQRFLNAQKKFVVDIGSNDGILLQSFKDAGFQVLGVDPAENIAQLANERGIPTLATFFGETVAKEIVQTHGQANAILSNNVVAHIDNHQDLCAGISTLLHPEGVWVIEAPYLIDMFENLTYDTIYHEHLSLLSVRPLQKLFARFNLELFDVKVVPAQGQSLRLFVGHAGAHAITAMVGELVQKELAFKLDQVDSYVALAHRVEHSKTQLLAKLQELKQQGKRIAAYGAPAKGMTVLNYCKIGTDILDFALEDLPSKQGLYTPGMRIPVVSREFATDHLPDYYLLLAWNYSKPIIEKEQQFMKQGGKFIIPVGDDINII